MLLWCSVNTQSFAHDISSAISQFINSKSKNLSRIVTSIMTFSVGTAGQFAYFILS